MKSDLNKKTALKVLIVDNNRQARTMIKHYLHELADVVAECADGADALDCYEKNRPDWVLMDWEMKQMNGLEATKQIIGKFPEAKILIVTQYNDRELRAAAFEAGVCGFVLKEDLAELRRFLAVPV